MSKSQRNPGGTAPGSVGDQGQFLHLAELNPDPVYVIDAKTGHVHFANAPARALFGVDLAGGLGWGGAMSRVHPDDLPRIEAQRQDLMQGRRTAMLDAGCRILDPASGWRTILLRERVHDHTPDGSVSRILGIAREIAGDAGGDRTLFQAAQEAAPQAFSLFHAVRDAEGQVVDLVWDYINPAGARSMGTTAEVLRGRRLLEVMPEVNGQGGVLARLIRVLETGHPLEEEREWAAPTLNGWYRLTAVRLGDGVAVQWLDITEIKHHEQASGAALEKREALLRELNHRIKNSLQLVASLLRLQASNIGEAPAPVVFERACQRVTAIAEVHARLYMTEEVGELDFGGYISAMVPRLAQSMPRVGPFVKAVVEEAEGTLDVDRAIPLGLVANELVSNALLHAFRETGEGRVSVGFKSGPEAARLWVADDGKGAVPDTDAPEKLGLRLVRALVAQVGGELTITRENGLRYDILVPHPTTPRRKEI